MSRLLVLCLGGPQRSWLLSLHTLGDNGTMSSTTQPPPPFYTHQLPPPPPSPFAALYHRLDSVEKFSSSFHVLAASYFEGAFGFLIKKYHIITDFLKIFSTLHLLLQQLFSQAGGSSFIKRKEVPLKLN